MGLRSLCRNWKYQCLWCGHVTWACWPLRKHDRCHKQDAQARVCGGPIDCEAVIA